MATFEFALPAARRAWARRLCNPLPEPEFDAMAKELFAWQFERVLAYTNLCTGGYKVMPQAPKDWREIPAAPQQLFKLKELFSHPELEPRIVYETSGTTTGQPGRQLLLSTDIYRSVAVEGARQAGFLRKDVELHFLTPSPSETPNSSLSAMFDFWRKSPRQSGQRFWVRRGILDFAGLRYVLEKSIRERKILGLAGTAFSFVHLLDAWVGLRPLRLPRGSWLLETGGFKGRSRELAKPELYASMARMFGVADDSIWNEYGMSELSSQAYARGTGGLHFTPPWARVLVWDPARNREVRVGQRGLVRWIDLANVDSVLAVQTLDLAERTPRGFRLIGRLPRTEPRGCSLSAEDIMVAQEKS